MMQILAKICRQGESVLFWTLACLHLLPVWAYHYVPTQDGPSHLDNAQILKELGNSDAGYDAFFEVRAEPIPNWTSHLILAGMLYVVPPLTAEKLLLSAYIMGFASSIRYFLGAFGKRSRPISWFGLLFIYNRCFWMGFYNFCLSLNLVWLILGYCLRRREQLRLAHASVLTVLFLLAYFTHLVGFVVALTGALPASIMAKPRRILAPILICVSASPSCFLTLDYFEQSGFVEQGAGRRLMRQSLMLLQGGPMEKGIDSQLLALDRELFEHHAGAHLPFTLFVIPLFLMLAAIASAESGYYSWLAPTQEATEVVDDKTDGEPSGAPCSRPAPSWLVPLLLGVVMLAFYLVVPNNLDGVDRRVAHGGFLKSRLALFAPLLWLACLREPVTPSARLVSRALVGALIGVNLFLVTRTFQADNEMLERFTAGIEAVGCGHRLVANGTSRTSRIANPLANARHYYCLGTNNVSVINYEASTPHFPIKYHRRVPLGNKTEVDVRINWQTSPGNADPAWELILARGDLQILRRREGRAPIPRVGAFPKRPG